MNILIFSPTPSHPQSAGNRIRIYNLANYLQLLGHRIHFCYYTQEGLTQDQETAMRNKWDSLSIIKKEKNYQLRGGYYLIDDWYQENLGPIVLNECLQKNIDIILVNYIFQSKVLEYIPKKILKIIDTHDRFSDRHIMMQKNGLEADFYFTVDKEEKKGLDRADIVLAIQENEANFFRSITKTNIKVLPHIESFHNIGWESKSLRKIGFIGSGNSVNLKSINIFIESFLQIVSDKNLDIELLIAGSICDKIELESEHIKKLGFVESSEEFYKKVDLIINPLILGTGLKIKSVEAIAYGLPILSTTVGFEGLDSDSKFHQASSVDELLKFLIELYENHTILKDLAADSVSIFSKYQKNFTKQISEVFHVDTIQKPLLAFITHINFWERDLGSRQRLYHLVKYLEKSFTLQIGYTEKRKHTDIKKLEEIGFQSSVVFLDEMPVASADISGMDTFLKKHPVLNPFARAELFLKVASWVQNQKIDTVIVEYLQFSYLLPLFPQTHKLLDSHDLMHIRNEVFKAQEQAHWIDISEAEELNIFREYDNVLSIQKNEHKYCIENKIASLLVPYSYECTQYKKMTDSKDIIFIGGDNLANYDAIKWFIDNVWPIFESTKLNLVISGSVCNAIKKNYKKLHKRIYLKGLVKNLEDVYRNAFIAINPVKLGGGLKIKNVEALAHGLPLITTVQGSFGLEDGKNDAYLCLNTIDEWKNGLISLLISRELRDTLSENAFNYAELNFGDEACYEELVHFIINQNKC